MHIAVLAADCYGVSGGIAAYSRDLVEALSLQSNVTRLTVVARNPGVIANGFIPPKVCFLEGGARGRLAFASAVARLAVQPIDLVLCGHINLLPLAVLLARLRRCRVVLVAYGIDVWQPPTRVIRYLLPAVEKVWAISEFTAKRMRAWSRFSGDRFVILPNAIRLEAFEERRDQEVLKEHYGVAGRSVLLTLARLVASERYKGIDEVLEVLPEIRRHVPDIAYLVAGSGDDLKRLQRKAVELDLVDTVNFLGFVTEEAKRDLYQCADLFVMPSRGEGFGFVFLESLASGTPVVASAVDGSIEAVRGGELGAAIDPTDRDQIITSILAGLKKPRGVPDGLTYFSFGAFCERAGAALQQVMAHETPQAARLPRNA